MHGLYLLWWVEERHLSPATVAAILAAGDLSITLLEIPTGWLADRFGHRLSLMVGSAVQVAGMLCCWLGEDVPGLLAASLLVALGDGFRSGADQALLYQSCAALDRQQDFQKIEARARAVQLVAMVGLVLAGGAIVETWGFAAGWGVETALCAAGLAIAWAMAEPGRSAAEGLECASPIPETTARARPYMWALLALTAPAALLSGAATAASFLAQTIGTADARQLTRLAAGLAVAEAAGAVIAARLPALGVRSQVVLACGGGIVVAVALAQPAALLPAVIVLDLLLGVAQPLRAAAIQRLSADGIRARAASVASACDKACDTVALMLAGFVPRRR